MRINNINNFHIYNNPYKPTPTQQSRFVSFAKKDTFKNSLKYFNPVTKEYDPKIKRKEKELINKHLRISHYANMTAIEGIDPKTGEYSPYFNKIIKHLLPTKFDDLFDILLNTNKTQVSSLFIWETSWQQEVPELIRSLKDNEGYFNKENYELTKNLIDGSYKNNQLQLPYIVKMINNIKDENGVVDEKLASYVEELSINRRVHGATIIKIIDFLKEFPQEKQEEIFNTVISQSPAKKQIDSEKDFIIRAQFCFDKNGKKIEENCNIVNEIYELSSDIIFPDAELFNLYKNSPQFKTLLNIIMTNKDGSFSQSYYEVKKHSKNGIIDVTTINRMLSILPFDRDLNCFEKVINACTNPNNEEFDNEKFKKIIDIFKINKTMEFQHSLSTAETIELVCENKAFENLPIREKLNTYERLKHIYTFSKTLPNNKDYEYLQEKIIKLENSFSTQNYELLANEKNIDIAINTILKSNNANEELTNFEKTIKKAIPKLKKYEEGLPLKYNRNNFLKDINRIVEKYPEAKNILIEQWGFSSDLKMPECFIENNQNTKNRNHIEKEVNSLVNKFLYENEIQTKDPELNKQLNILIKAFPEFISTIGREQHGTHSHTVDIHTLLVLAEAIQNPNYQKLNAKDKETLKTVALFHDISKKEKEVDKEHPTQSAICAKNILRKTNKTEAELNRIYELIKNHDFLEKLDNANYKTPIVRKIAFYFRRPNDFEIAKIITEADLKSVNNYFYEAHKSKLREENLKSLSNAILTIQSSGNAIFPSYITNKKALDNQKQIIDGKEYTIINTHDFGINENLAKYGFEEGTKKQDLGFLVHMTDQLNTLTFLNNSEEESVLSESFITPLHKTTYSNKKYGVFLKHNNYDIINMAKENQASGRTKNIKSILYRIFDDNFERNSFVFDLLHNLQIINKSTTLLGSIFSNFYNDILSNITSLNEIDSKKIYNIGENKFTGGNLISALKKTQKELLHKTNDSNNEIIAFAPEIQGLIAKEKDPNNLPKYFLDFAYKNNYPIVLI